MTKIKNLCGRFQKVTVQFEDKGDKKMIDYKDISMIIFLDSSNHDIIKIL